MTDGEFDVKKAKENLMRIEAEEKEANEKMRQKMLQKVCDFLKQEFKGQNIEIYLVGSITQPYQFTKRSDIDIELKNFQGDRLELGCKLDRAMERDVDIIRFETCSFQDFVIKYGLKVM